MYTHDAEELLEDSLAAEAELNRCLHEAREAASRRLYILHTSYAALLRCARDLEPGDQRRNAVQDAIDRVRQELLLSQINIEDEYHAGNS